MVIFSEIKKDSLSYNLDKNDVQKEQKNLADKVKKRDDVLKLFAKKADLWFWNSDNSALSENWNLIKEKIEKKFENENTARSELLKHPQVQSFLDKYIADYSAEWPKNNDSSNDKKAKTNENESEKGEEIIESLDEYMSHELSPDKLEEFLLSDEGIRILKDEIDDHVDEEWNLYKNFKISNKSLRIKLETARRRSIRREYNQKYNVFKEDEKEDIKKMWDLIANWVHRCVVKYLQRWESEFNEELIKDLETLLSSEENKNLIEKLGKDADFKYEFKLSLRESIKRYSNIVLKNNNVSLNTWDAQIDLQLKSYLYLYGKLFYPKIFKTNQWNQYYEWILPEIMAAILAADDKRLENIIRNNEFLEQEKKAEEARKKREEERRREIAKRNREINERQQSRRDNEKIWTVDKLHSESQDPNDATWVEIAANANLWETLKDYKLNIDIEKSKEKQERLKETAFREAWKEFIRLHDDMKSYIKMWEMRLLFDVNNSILNNHEREIFKNTNILLKGMSTDEVEKIHSILSSFSSNFNAAEKRLSNNSSDMKVKIDETVRIHAIWTVIDNVRDTFYGITNEQKWNIKWLQLDSKNPVRKEWENIIISGTFNGSEVKVRYDLRTGELFMNSFLHKLSPSKIRLWINSSMDYPIWKIKSFNDVLNDYYKFPTRPTDAHMTMQRPSVLTNNTNKDVQNHRIWWSWVSSILLRKAPANQNSNKSDIQNLLNSQNDLIGDAIMNGTERQAAKNSSIMGFMKTFNIIKINDSENFKNIDFNEWSNLFRFIQIIERTSGDNNESNNGAQTLEYFTNTFMPLLMNWYSWLKWWENNMQQDKWARIFNNNNINDEIKYLRDKVGDFNPNQFSGVANFENSHQLKFIDLIEEKLLDSKLKLDITKMQEFIKSIETRWNNLINSGKILS